MWTAASIQPPQCDYLLAQDIAHVDAGYSPHLNQCPGSDSLLAGFQVIIVSRFWAIPEAQAADRNFALEKLASALHTVLSLANRKPVVLVGHSIGAMINLTFRRLYPDFVGAQIAGIAQVDTTYTNPVKTTKGAAFSLPSRSRCPSLFCMR